jgi:hypothetical protein
MNCCTTVLLRYYGNTTGCIGHVTKENPICHNILQEAELLICVPALGYYVCDAFIQNRLTGPQT